jgi:hypothetical protein
MRFGRVLLVTHITGLCSSRDAGLLTVLFRAALAARICRDDWNVEGGIDERWKTALSSTAVTVTRNTVTIG